MTLMSKLPTVPDLYYRAVMDYLFTNPSVLQVSKESGIPAIVTVRANNRKSWDYVNDKKSYVDLVCLKDNKVPTVASALYGKEPMRRASRYIKDQDSRVKIYQPNAISFYNKTMDGVDWMDQNISAYMINIRNKK